MHKPDNIIVAQLDPFELNEATLTWEQEPSV